MRLFISHLRLLTGLTVWSSAIKGQCGEQAGKFTCAVEKSTKHLPGNSDLSKALRSLPRSRFIYFLVLTSGTNIRNRKFSCLEVALWRLYCKEWRTPWTLTMNTGVTSHNKCAKMWRCKTKAPPAGMGRMWAGEECDTRRILIILAVLRRSVKRITAKMPFSAAQRVGSTAPKKRRSGAGTLSDLTDPGIEAVISVPRCLQQIHEQAGTVNFSSAQRSW